MTELSITPAAELFSEQERRVIKSAGHTPDPTFTDLQLARRVLQLPDTGEHSQWYMTSAVTLAAALIKSQALSLPPPGVREAMAAAYEECAKIANERAEHWRIQAHELPLDGAPYFSPRDMMLQKMMFAADIEGNIRARIASLPTGGDREGADETLLATMIEWAENKPEWTAHYRGVIAGELREVVARSKGKTDA